MTWRGGSWRTRRGAGRCEQGPAARCRLAQRPFSGPAARCAPAPPPPAPLSAPADPTVCLMGEDVGHYGGSYKVSYGLYKKFGEMRLLDTPICGGCARRGGGGSGGGGGGGGGGQNGGGSQNRAGRPGASANNFSEVDVCLPGGDINMGARAWPPLRGPCRAAGYPYAASRPRHRCCLHGPWAGPEGRELTRCCPPAWWLSAENGFLGMGVGAAMTGLRPVVSGGRMHCDSRMPGPLLDSCMQACARARARCCACCCACCASSRQPTRSACSQPGSGPQRRRAGGWEWVTA